ncbi:MAG: hypothetical protein A2544_01365 [Candidatus Zambryskibacteria bacterium RIFOXYD2_FULL_43_10]|uniref:Uncharacterized protein n=1 Tax=Candidatus Zambryskibacteria bacterium RIFOXYD2_FULL_43_10 TaxID=1802782 RepID=A0A1G2V8D5_9BACT|nr:MAG: hypothetical protein A2544_01365 [Candidatus Zambryskibacteria bacterium RIFOXYD2_FULL_43_10]
MLFFIPVTFTIHAFWKPARPNGHSGGEEGQARMMERVQFMKNLAILGAILMLLTIPIPWPMSLGS